MCQQTHSYSHFAACQLTLIDNKGEHIFSSDDIIRMQAADNYTIVYFHNRSYPFVVSKVLKVYEKLLGPYGFVRTHRSHLVNRQFVKQVSNKCIVMQDASVAKVARQKREICIQQLIHTR